MRIGISCRNASPTSRSEPVIPGRSAFVESPSIRSTPRFPIAASLPTSVLRPSTGVWSSFQSPVWSTRPAGVSIDDRDAVGDRVRHAHELELERADLHRRRRRGRPRAASSTRRAVLVELRLDHRERQLRADHLAHLDLAQHVRQRADVILVAVREHDREQRPVLEVREVRQHEIDAEVLVAREGEPGVDQDALAVELVEGHVLADLAEPAERDDAERVAHGRDLSGGWIIVPQCTDAGSGAGPGGASTRSGGGSLQQPEPLEAAADGRLLLGRRVDERQPEAADVVAEQVERRLDRDRVRLHAEQVDRGAQLLVERAGTVERRRPGSARPSPSPAARRRACGRRCRRRRRPRGTGGSGRRRRRRGRARSATTWRAASSDGFACLTAGRSGSPRAPRSWPARRRRRRGSGCRRRRSAGRSRPRSPRRARRCRAAAACCSTASRRGSRRRRSRAPAR